MLAFVIGILMSLGIISTETDFNSLSEAQQQELIMEWVGEDDGDGF